MREIEFNVRKWPSLHTLLDAIEYADEKFRVQLTLEKSGITEFFDEVEVCGLVRDPSQPEWYKLMIIIHGRPRTRGTDETVRPVRTECRLKLKGIREQGSARVALD